MRNQPIPSISAAVPALPSRVAALYLTDESVIVYAHDLSGAQQERARLVARSNAANRAAVVVLRTELAA